MEIKHLLLKDNGKNDHVFIAGEIKNNQLNGWGLEEVATPEGTKKTYGHFVDGKLDDVGVIESIDRSKGVSIVEYGFYMHGEHIDDEAFMKMAKEEKVMETIAKFNLDFTNVSKYFLAREDDKSSGLRLVYSHQTRQYGNTDNDYKNHVFKEYQCISRGKVVGFSFSIMLHPKYQTRYRFTSFEENQLFYEMLDDDWGYTSTQSKEIFIQEGTEVIKRNTFTGTENVVIHIPSSVTTIEEQAINPKKKHYVEVYYDGTKEEWERIKKGHCESWCEDDPYRVGMGTSHTIRVDWAVHNHKITIHCLDGDIIDKDHSYRD